MSKVIVKSALIVVIVIVLVVYFISFNSGFTFLDQYPYIKAILIFLAFVLSLHNVIRDVRNNKK